MARANGQVDIVGMNAGATLGECQPRRQRFGLSRKYSGIKNANEATNSTAASADSSTDN